MERLADEHEAEIDPVVFAFHESENVKKYRQKSKHDALLVRDPLSGIQKYVPVLTGIEHSSILGRRRKNSEITQSTSLNSRISSKKKKRPGRPSKKLQSNCTDISNAIAHNTFRVEEVDSPTVMSELFDFNVSNGSRRMTY